jgi:hypothetical protein
VHGQQALIIADQATQVDLDLFDVELGLPDPVAAFQIKQSSESCCLSYEIYSLRGQPRLLRRLHGGFFNAADTDLDGRVEIWAEDGEAVDGIDEIPASSFEFLPTYVLRFEHEQLVDASREFTQHFDQIIEGLRAKLTADQLAEFKGSDGKLTFSIAQVDRLRNLRTTKIAILEIVWSYLYSGREEEAWRTLREMWPAADAERIQTALTDRRKRGILMQLDGVSAGNGPRKHCPVFEQSEDTTPARVIDPSFPSVAASLGDELGLNLVIDSAGKVRVVKPEAELDPYSLAYIQAWKFVPATRGGHSVASHLRISVSLKR